MRFSLETLAVIASLLTFSGGIVAWYSASVQKKYAAMRDFQHLQRSYEQLATNQTAILRELDDRFDKLSQDMDSRFNQALLEAKDLKGVLTAVMVQMNQQGTQSGWIKKTDQS